MESLANGEVVPMPTLPEKYACSTLGSNQNLAEVVAVLPIVMMSVLLRE